MWADNGMLYGVQMLVSKAAWFVSGIGKVSGVPVCLAEGGSSEGESNRAE